MFRFDPHDDVEATFRAIALDQIEAALAAANGAGDTRSAVHEARRRCKKLRALLKLVRPVFADYAIENDALREAAAGLSHLRDTEVLQHTVAALGEAVPGAALRQMETRAAAAVPSDAPRPPQLDVFADRLRAVRDRAGGWALSTKGCDALLPGFDRTYRSDRRRMTRAARTGRPEDFHDWRKANKAHDYHLGLLRRLAPAVVDPARAAVGRLSDLLGEHHDLTVLLAATAHDPTPFGSPAEVALLAAAAAARRESVGQEALGLGRQLLAEKPKALRRRFAAYWHQAR